MNKLFMTTPDEAIKRSEFINLVDMKGASNVANLPDEEYETAQLTKSFQKSLRAISLVPGLAGKLSDSCLQYREKLGEISAERGEKISLRALVSDTLALLSSYASQPDTNRYIASDLEDFSKYSASMFKDFRVDKAFSNGEADRAVDDVVSNVIVMTGREDVPESVASTLRTVGRQSLDQLHQINEIKAEKTLKLHIPAIRVSNGLENGIGKSDLINQPPSVTPSYSR